MSALRLASVLLFALAAGGCPPPDGSPDGGVDGGTPFFPADVATSLTEVRGCENSIEHDLVPARVFANALAEGPFHARDVPFPEGALLVKVEYVDAECTEVSGYTGMEKLAAGADEASYDWRWQRATAGFTVDASYDLRRCTACHASCGSGHDRVCTLPP